MQLSLNFTYEEFIHSNTATDLGYNLSTDEWEFEQVKRLVTTAMQPIRDELGKAITITSGYRSPWLNYCIRGAKNSRHMYGCACDFVVTDMTVDEAFDRIRGMDLDLDQLIIEFPKGDGPWLHLGLALPGQHTRKQYMIATKGTDGRVTYLNA